jgi:hypothetical protein
MIRRAILSKFFCGCLFIYGDPNIPTINIQCTPYFYGELFTPGYGVSLRLQTSKHTFELAPLFAPAASSYFGSYEQKLGGSCSYYYTFFQNASLRPYLGISYTYLKELYNSKWLNVDLSDPIYQNAESYGANFYTSHYATSLVGLQYSRIATPSLYCFIDVLGPIFLSKEVTTEYDVKPPYDGSIEKTVDPPSWSLSDGIAIIPRIGVGFSF